MRENAQGAFSQADGDGSGSVIPGCELAVSDVYLVMCRPPLHMSGGHHDS